MSSLRGSWSVISGRLTACRIPHRSPEPSHASAALVHGFDMWNVDLRRVHISGNKGRITESLHRHQTQFSDGDVVDLGVPVTSIERTIVDLARSLPFEQAVVAGDAAPRQDPSARNRLEGAVAAASWDHGTAAVRAVVAFIDGRSESVGESRSRVRRSCSRSSSPDTDTPIVSISSGRTLESSASSTDSANTTTAATSWRRSGAKTLSAHSDSNARAGNARKGA
jgi:hypothetical protein